MSFNKQCRTKLGTYEAVQWDGTADNCEMIKAWALQRRDPGIEYRCKHMPCEAGFDAFGEHFIRINNPHNGVGFPSGDVDPRDWVVYDAGTGNYHVVGDVQFQDAFTLIEDEGGAENND